MIQKQTWVKIADSSLAKWSKTFQLYGGFSRANTSTGNFIKGSVRIVQPPIQTYKGFTVRIIMKGKVSKILITRQVYNSLFFNWLGINFKLNSGIILKKKKIPSSQHILGPTTRNIRFKKYILFFHFIF
uniref:50S ribosomal protein L14 n=1 Tax=Euplotes vanleeuwenhoeki TaxID=2794224 RepID=A0A7T1C4X2_9SPIT|nr:50S ribosomal protein L14 [Euplotes vanleeuwenhoeki]QPM99240.1 50S ribosomal protein L14 [Euplotes vanleeuwenhoeki]